MSSLSSLPDEVLKLVMQHVPILDRLSSCCLVSRKLHAAATAATDQLQIPYRLQRYNHLVQSVLAWMWHYGQYLTSLRWCHVPQPLRELPCTNLLQLHVGYECQVQLGATDGYPGVIAGCTKLTHLDLQGNITDAPQGTVVDCLSSLVHLEHLFVQPTQYDRMCYRLAGLSAATLPRLQHLTTLHFSCLSVENMLQLGGLANLQELYLAAAVVEGMAVGAKSIPGLAFPASLQKLVLACVSEASILSLVPTGLQELQVPRRVEGPAEGPGSFLSGMARLQHLTALSLHVRSKDLCWPPAGPAYSALTASSNLVQLSMVDSSCPHGIWPYVFHTNCKLPHLRVLKLTHDTLDDAAPPPWGAMELSSLASCCPSLCDFEVLSLQPGLHISELHKLTALTRLRAHHLCSDWHSFEHSVRGLAALTQLQELEVQVNRCHRLASLLPLTRLTSLTSLNVFQASDEDQWNPEDGPPDWPLEDEGRQAECMDVSLYKLSDNSAPDVWLQLLERCAADRDCHPRTVCSLAQQLAEQRALHEQQIARLQGQMLEQQQYAAMQAGLQQQLQELQAEVQQLRQVQEHQLR